MKTPSLTSKEKARREEIRRRKRLARAEKWHRGDLSFLLHDGQKKIDTIYRTFKGQLFVGNISRQWGKSFWAVVKALEQCIRNPRSRVKYGTAFYVDLAEFILPAFEKILETCPESIKPKYISAKSKWVFPNGSEIKLVGLDLKPNGLRGNTIDLIIIDEAGFVEKLEYIYKSIIIPATLHRPNCRVVFISTPPSTPAHAFVDYIQMAELRGAYVKLTIYDNPMVTQADIDRMAEEVGGYGTTTFRREFLGELVTDDNLTLCAEWNTEKHAAIVVRDEFYNYYHKLVGMDLGRRDNTAVVFGYYDFKRAALVIEEELTMEGTDWTTETLRDEIRRTEWELWSEDKSAYIIKPPAARETQVVNTFRRVSDNNNPHLLTDLSSIHNLHFMPVKKESSLEQMVNRVREWVKNDRIIIHPKCKMLIGCLQYGVWDKNRKEFAQSKVYGHFDHFAALMYLLIHTPSSSNPIPATHGYQPHRAFLEHVKGPPTPNARALEKAFGLKKKF